MLLFIYAAICWSCHRLYLGFGHCSHRCRYYIAVRFHRFVYNFFSLLFSFVHSLYVFLILLSSFYVWFICLFFTTVFPNLIVFFLFASICLKHDFKLPEIAYFFSLFPYWTIFVVVVDVVLVVMSLCCFHFFFHSILFRSGFVLVWIGSVYIKVVAKSVYIFFCFVFSCIYFHSQSQLYWVAVANVFQCNYDVQFQEVDSIHSTHLNQM